MINDHSGIDDQHGDFDEQRPPSKSQRKRDMLALQKLGQTLTELKPAQLAKIPLDEDLLHAVTEMQRIRQREGRRRQLQYIGRLMQLPSPAFALEVAIHRPIDALSRPRSHRTRVGCAEQRGVATGTTTPLDRTVARSPAIG